MSAHVGSCRLMALSDRSHCDGRRSLSEKKRTRVDAPCDQAEALGTDQLASALLLTEKKYAR
jgi:hypothetical protein